MILLRVHIEQREATHVNGKNNVQCFMHEHTACEKRSINSLLKQRKQQLDLNDFRFFFFIFVIGLSMNLEAAKIL